MRPHSSLLDRWAKVGECWLVVATAQGVCALEAQLDPSAVFSRRSDRGRVPPGDASRRGKHDGPAEGAGYDVGFLAAHVRTAPFMGAVEVGLGSSFRLGGDLNSRQPTGLVNLLLHAADGRDDLGNTDPAVSCSHLCLLTDPRGGHSGDLGSLHDLLSWVRRGHRGVQLKHPLDIFYRSVEILVMRAVEQFSVAVLVVSLQGFGTNGAFLDGQAS